MEDEIKELLNKGLEEETEVKNYNGRIYTLYELRASANNFKANDSKTCREKLKKKYSKIYNCKTEVIPVELLREVYEINENNEVWKNLDEFRNKDYSVSSYGRIKHFGKLVKQEEHKELSGYLYMVSYLNEDTKFTGNTSIEVYKFISAGFYNENYKVYEQKHEYDIHHINNNGYDCRPDNLIPLTPREHSKVHGFLVSTDKERT